jgi:small subunit ribosomal protein S2
MSRTDFNTLLEAGAHFGHLKRKWNPKMAPYIFMEKNGIHIIDLHKTVLKLDEAANALKQIAKSGRRVLFVATKKQAKEIVAEKIAAIGMPYVTERWAGGMLTNFPTIRKAVKKMSTIDKMTNDGTFDNFSKRRASACETREEPRFDRRPDPSAGRSVRRGRAEGVQRREGGQAIEYSRICNGRYLL